MEKITRAVVEGLKADIQELTEERDIVTEKFTQVSKGFKDVQKERDTCDQLRKDAVAQNDTYRKEVADLRNSLRLEREANATLRRENNTANVNLGRALGYIDRVNEGRSLPKTDEFSSPANLPIGPKISGDSY